MKHVHASEASADDDCVYIDYLIRATHVFHGKRGPLDTNSRPVTQPDDVASHTDRSVLRLPYRHEVDAVCEVGFHLDIGPASAVRLTGWTFARSRKPTRRKTHQPSVGLTMQIAAPEATQDAGVRHDTNRSSR